MIRHQAVGPDKEHMIVTISVEIFQEPHGELFRFEERLAFECAKSYEVPAAARVVVRTKSNVFVPKGFGHLYLP